jgi:Zn-dependent protease/predicted transcriptional regulator
MGNGARIFSIGGIGIYVNWSWIIAIAIVTWSVGDFFHVNYPSWSTGTAYALGLLSGVLLFVTVLIHELAHSFTARANGLPVNTITLFIFGGVSNLTQEPQTPRTEFLVAIAGPLTSLVLSGIFYVLYLALHGGPSEVTAVLGYLASVNLILAIFNLIPGFPLDGGRVLRSIVWAVTGNLRRATHIASNIGDGFGYLFIIGGLLEAFVAGDVIAGIWLAFIGWFLHNAATASYQQAVMDRVLIGVEVRNVMDPAPVGVGPSMSVQEAVEGYMMTRGIRALPVNGPDGSLLGLVTLTDVQQVPRDHWATTPVSNVMTPVDQLRTTAPDAGLREALAAMAEHNYNQLPVVANGRVVGMLNRGHVLQWIHLREVLAQKQEAGKS